MWFSLCWLLLPCIFSLFTDILLFKIALSWCLNRETYWMCVFITVQHECIPQAILGMDVLCQAKSGMGKTAVFVLATLQQLEPVTGQVMLHLI